MANTFDSPERTRRNAPDFIHLAALKEVQHALGRLVLVVVELGAQLPPALLTHDAVVLKAFALAAYATDAHNELSVAP